MFARTATSLLISLNDLEAIAIAELAKATGNVDVVDLGLGWGDPPDARLAKIAIARLAPTVIMVECPSPAYEVAVIRSGRTLHIVDHHLRYAADGSLLDRRSKRSALEQVAHLLGKPRLDDDQRLIAANDAGFWRGLFHELGSNGPLTAKQFLNQAGAVRLRDLAVVLGARTSAEIAAAEAKASAMLKEADGYFQLALQSGAAVTVRPQTRQDTPDQKTLIMVKAAREVRFLPDAIYRWWSSAISSASPKALHLPVCHPAEISRSGFRAVETPYPIARETRASSVSRSRLCLKKRAKSRKPGNFLETRR